MDSTTAGATGQGLRTSETVEAAPVRARRVFYIPGYDPIHPRRYRELYRKEGAAQAEISNYDLSLTPQPPAPGGTGQRPYGWQVAAKIDGQEVRNAVDQAQREVSTRFDFKNTNSTIDQNDMVITLQTVSEDRLAALRVVLEERLVKRGVSLKGVEYGDVAEASQNTVRQVVTIKVGISSEKAKEINKLIKASGPKGVSSQTQGESVRVSGKKRDDLQAVIALLKGADLGIPLQFQNFRD